MTLPNVIFFPAWMVDVELFPDPWEFKVLFLFLVSVVTLYSGFSWAFLKVSLHAALLSSTLWVSIACFSRLSLISLTLSLISFNSVPWLENSPETASRDNTPCFPSLRPLYYFCLVCNVLKHYPIFCCSVFNFFRQKDICRSYCTMLHARRYPSIVF